MNATKKYLERQQNIAAALAALRRVLDRHNEQQRERPTDWGYPGDLGYVEERLGEALAHLGGCNDV